MGVDQLPYVGRPMFVQFMRILNEEDLVRIDLVIAVRHDADGNRETFAVLLKYGHHLFVAAGVGRAIDDNVFDIELLDWTQRSGGLLEIRGPGIRRVGKAIALANPNRLPGQFLGILQVLRMQLLWRDVVVDRKSTRLNSSHANISYAVF